MSVPGLLLVTLFAGACLGVSLIARRWFGDWAPFVRDFLLSFTLSYGAGVVLIWWYVDRYVLGGVRP